MKPTRQENRRKANPEILKASVSNFISGPAQLHDLFQCFAVGSAVVIHLPATHQEMFAWGRWLNLDWHPAACQSPRFLISNALNPASLRANANLPIANKVPSVTGATCGLVRRRRERPTWQPRYPVQNQGEQLGIGCTSTQNVAASPKAPKSSFQMTWEACAKPKAWTNPPEHTRIQEQDLPSSMAISGI